MQDKLIIRFESNLKGGKQSSEQPRENLEYGVSITDGESCNPVRRIQQLIYSLC